MDNLISNCNLDLHLILQPPSTALRVFFFFFFFFVALRILHIALILLYRCFYTWKVKPNMSDGAKPRWVPPRAGFAVGLFVAGVITTIGVQRFVVTRRLAPSPNRCDSPREDIKSENESDVARGPPCPSQGRARGGGFGGFTSLRLVSTQDVNHNTKRLRFEVPESSSLGKFTLSCRSSFASSASFH